jgi:nicotinate dehydrogenase subunit A
MPTYPVRLNGRRVPIQSWDPDQPLLYALRGAPGLRGAKIGCGLGQCGTCTVLLDDQAVRACMVPVKSAANRRVTTIEGLGTPDKPDPLQAAFIAEQAAQCGYCTTGMIMAARALLRRIPRPTEQQVADALDGNLCRCGAYTRIIRAVLRAAGR